MKTILIIAVVVSGILTVAPQSTFAANHPRNPFTGYNLSGINYGSQQWEAKYGRRSYSYSNRRSPRRSGAYYRRPATSRYYSSGNAKNMR